MTIKNETTWETRDLARIFRAGLRALGIEVKRKTSRGERRIERARRRLKNAERKLRLAQTIAKRLEKRLGSLVRNAARLEAAGGLSSKRSDA